MLRLREILLCNYFFYIILFIVLIISFIRISLFKVDKPVTNNITGIVTSIIVDGNKLTLNIKSKENYIGTYFFKRKSLRDNFINTINIGDKLYLEGRISIPNKNTTKYLFNYQDFLKSRNVKYLISINNYKLISKNKNIYYYIKSKIIKYFNSNPYLNTFLLGNKNYIKTSVTKSYQANGISHLFAISGMHISLISGILLKLLKKVKEEKRYFIVSIILMFYLLLVGPSPSVIRGVLFFILFSINKVYYFYIEPLNIFYLTLSITLFYNPFFIYDLGFKYSFLISFSLLYSSSILKGNYITSLLKVSLISCLVSIPITLENFFKINLLSILLNLFYVPLVSIIIFPFTIITSIFKFLLPLYNILINILESTSLFFSKITCFTLVFYRLPTIFYYLYLVLILFILYEIKKNNYKYILILFITLIVHYIYPYINNASYIKMIDIGQGDSILLHSNNESILIDTGGKLNYDPKWSQKNKTSNIADTTLIPLFNSLGIKELKYLIITHGDQDHIGEALNLINNFKVDKVILNQGHINYKEYLVLKNKKEVFISKELNEINCGDINLIELNSYYDDENDSSQFYLSNYKDIDMLFTGDASQVTEKDVLKKYNLPKLEILKVGHHGSRTSTSTELLEETNPDISLISAGRHNKFKHPHQITLDNLEKYNSKYYLTARDGTITVNLKTLKVTTDM